MTLKAFIFRFAAPLAITLLILLFFFRDASPADIISAISRLPLLNLGLFAILTLCAVALRAWKYYILLEGKASFGDVLLITLIRNCAVDFLPAQSAALALYSWLARRQGVSGTEAATSFVVSAFYDTLALSIMLGGVVFFLPSPQSRIILAGAVLLLFLFSIIMLLWGRPLIFALLRHRRLRRLHKVEKILPLIARYLRNHQRNGERWGLLSLSLAIRICKYVFVFILFAGLAQTDIGPQHFPTFCFGLAGAELSSLSPVQGLAGFGTWELAFSTAFTSLNLPISDIRETGFAIHIITQTWEYLAGGVSFLYLTWRRRKTRISAAE